MGQPVEESIPHLRMSVRAAMWSRRISSIAAAGRKAAHERCMSPIGQSMQRLVVVLGGEVGWCSKLHCCGPLLSATSRAAMMLSIAGRNGAETKVTVGAGAGGGALQVRHCG